MISDVQCSAVQCSASVGQRMAGSGWCTGCFLPTCRLTLRRRWAIHGLGWGVGCESENGLLDGGADVKDDGEEKRRGA